MPRAPKAPTLDQLVQSLSDGLKENAYAPNLKQYVPHKKQEIFHSSRKTAKLYIGGNRSGKTTGGVTEAIWRATATHPYRPELNRLGPIRGRVVGVDFKKGVNEILLPQFKQWCYPSALRGGSWDSAYDRGANILNFANLSTIEFMSYEQSIDKFAGTSRHFIHFDEEPPQPIWLECLARLIDTGGDYWITMTPVEGMTWIYDELYEKNHGKEDATVEIVEIGTTENPYLDETAIKTFADNVTDQDDLTVRLAGGFVRKGGLVYPNFDPVPGVKQVLSEVVNDPKETFHKREWLWILGVDHGLNNPTAALWMAVNTSGFCVVFDEHYQRELTVDQHARILKQKFKEHGRVPDLMVIDPSTKNRSPISGTSVHQEYQKYGISFIMGNNDVKSGTVRVRKYFNPAPYLGQGKHDLFKGSDSFCKLRISPRCVNLIWELKRYRWKTYANKQLQYENNPYDEPHKKDDHACDALRYMIMTRPDLVAKTEDDMGAKINAAMDDLEDRMGRYDERLIDRDDPQGRLEGLTEFIPGLHNPSPAGPVGDEWEFDEHMGGLL